MQVPKEIQNDYENLKKQFQQQWQLRKMQTLADKIASLQELEESPTSWQDGGAARKIGQDKAELERTLTPWKSLRSQLEDFPILIEITLEELQTAAPPTANDKKLNEGSSSSSSSSASAANEPAPMRPQAAGKDASTSPETRTSPETKEKRKQKKKTGKSAPLSTQPQKEIPAFLELAAELQKIQNHFRQLITASALTGADDKRYAILTITPGAGGTESQDWAEILLRMYSRWCEKKDFRYKTLDLHAGDEAGIKSASLLIQGANAYGLLKSENGIHRLVRLSPFDSNKKRHTSFVAIHVSPQIDENVHVEMAEKDLRIDTFRASGAGGQHVNKTDSAIRITHLPSKIVIQCQSERSQHNNRKQAMEMLRARLYELEKQKLHENREKRAGEKRDVAWGNQIRSYVLHPYKMVKDLRTNHETSNTEDVLDGSLDPFIDAYLENSGNLMGAKL